MSIGEKIGGILTILIFAGLTVVFSVLPGWIGLLFIPIYIVGCIIGARFRKRIFQLYFATVKPTVIILSIVIALLDIRFVPVIWITCVYIGLGIMIGYEVDNLYTF
jgi:hypothetical protein